MSEPAEPAPRQHRSPVEAVRELLGDPVSFVGLGAVALTTALYLLPIVPAARLAAWSEGPLFVPLIAWVVLATAVRARRAAEPPERSFWGLISLGFLAWLLTVLLSLLPAWSSRAPLLTLLYDGLSAACYLCLILATTRAPHERHGTADRSAETSLVVAGTAIFGLGMTAYFDLVPFLVDRADFDSRAPAFYLFLALDVPLIARAAVQLRGAKGSRWHVPYALFLLSTLLLGLGDLLDLLRRLGYSAYTSGTATDFLWYGIFIAMGLAAGLHRPPSPAEPPAARREVLYASPLLTFAIIVPVVHFALSGASLLGARSQHPREAVALATMAAVLFAAWWRQALAERRHLALLEDLERERERLRNAERLESVGRLAGGVAHDFNNQLAVIVGYAESLADATSSRPDLAAPVRAIQEAARVAAELTRDLLAVGQRHPLMLRAFDLREALEALAPKLRKLLGPSVRLELACRVESAPVLADRVQVERALLALATNAREALDRGGYVRISLAPADARSEGTPRQVELSVTDDGRGMTSEVLSHALEPFFTTKPFGQGSGLGLASVHGIIEQSGGTVKLESRMGEGTRVTIRLPLTSAGTNATNAPPSAG